MMKFKLNVKMIFVFIAIFLITTVISQSPAGVQNTEIFTPFLPLEPTATPQTRTYNFVLSKAILAPDGFSKEIFSINGQYPGPIIHANKGDRIYVNITNALGEETAMHWHGIFQRGSNWYDGVPAQTQCAIQNGVSFVYDFQTGEQVGTYWYHAHIHGQYMEGLRAPLIIHDPNDPYRTQYDSEYIITLSDWYHQRIADMIRLRMAPNYAGFNPIPDAALISGIGRYDCTAAPAGSACTANNPLPVYKVISGTRYRLRIINTSGLGHFVFSIDNHQLWIIEADGEYTKPVSVNKLPVAIGQRYSVIVNADQPVNNYWMRANLEGDCLLQNPDTININSAINYNATGILRYDGAAEVDPTTTNFVDTVTACLGLDPNFLKLLTPRPVPQPLTQAITLNFTIRPDPADNVVRAYVNNSTYVPDFAYPTLEKLVNGQVPVTQLPASENIYTLDTFGGVYDIYVLNANLASHPFHIHGHNFYVLGTGQGLVVDPSTFNLVDPFPRDTFALSGISWAVFRYIADNPGVWSVHCHIDWHVEMGMVAQIVELPTELAKLTIPPAVTSLCSSPKTPKTPAAKAAKKRSLPLRRKNKFKVAMKV